MFDVKTQQPADNVPFVNVFAYVNDIIYGHTGTRIQIWNLSWLRTIWNFAESIYLTDNYLCDEGR